MTALPLVLPGGAGPDDLDFAKQGGLVPAVVQDSRTGRVLMVGYQDREALEATLRSGLATFHSRSRGSRWVKGETSGNTLTVERVEVDCDRDTVLLHCAPAGPTCHTGSISCFDQTGDDQTGQEPAERAAPGRPGTFLADLDALVSARRQDLPEGSYTTRLFTGGVRRIAQKVGEEGVETALAAVAQDRDELLGEASDLVYHLLVLLHSRDLSLADVERLLEQRHRG